MSGKSDKDAIKECMTIGLMQMIIKTTNVSIIKSKTQHLKRKDNNCHMPDFICKKPNSKASLN